MPGTMSDEQRRGMWANIKARMQGARDFSRGLKAAPTAAASAGRGLVGKLSHGIATMPTTFIADKAAEAAGVMTETVMKHFLDQAVDKVERDIAAHVDLAEERWARRMEKALQTSQMAIAGGITPPELRVSKRKEYAAEYMKERSERLAKVRTGASRRKLRHMFKQAELEKQLRQNMAMIGRMSLGLEPHQQVGAVAQAAFWENYMKNLRDVEEMHRKAAREAKRKEQTGRY